MTGFFTSSVFFCLFATLAAYFVGMEIKKRTGLALMNPLLIAIVIMMFVISILKIDYAVYESNTKMLTSLLTPATICLAVPLYEQFSLLKKHPSAILAGILSGVLTSLVCIFALSFLFGLDHASYVTLLPKSITSAIGMGVSQELGGYPSITVPVILITGILGNITAETICRVFRITEPVAVGVAIGVSSHAIGTSKAMEIGQIQGAMSSLSIVVSGILTVFGASIFSCFL